MSLKDIFDYERLEASQNPSLSLVPLSQDSGPQYAKTNLMADLLFQLGFCSRVQDILSYPIILDATDKPIAGDVLIENWSSYLGYGHRILIIINDEFHTSNLDRNRIDAAIKYCAAQPQDSGHEFRILGPAEILTPYLDNARILHRFVQDNFDEQSEAADLLYSHLRHTSQNKPTTVRQALTNLLANGTSQAESERTIGHYVAHGRVICNLDQPYGPSTKIWFGNGLENADNRSHSLLRKILSAPSASTISKLDL